MPYTIELTDMRVENLQIYKQFNDNGVFIGLTMSLNCTLYNDSEQSESKHVEFELTPAQRTQVLNFIKPFIQQAAVDFGVNPPNWAS